MIDLHNAYDRVRRHYSPQELVDAGHRLGLDALAITDHDTFAGYEQARPFGIRQG